jgi:hypothetical protein
MLLGIWLIARARSPKDPASAMPSAQAAAPAQEASAPEVASAAPPEPTAPSANGDPASAGGEDAELTVVCEPACDIVLVGGKKVDDASTPQRLAPGKYIVTGLKRKFHTLTRVVVLEPGKRQDLALTLQPKKCGRFIKNCD